VEVEAQALGQSRTVVDAFQQVVFSQPEHALLVTRYSNIRLDIIHQFRYIVHTM
jgi:hypothetical protein